MATEAGTFGRVCGDMAISIFSVYWRSQQLLTLLFSSFAALLLLCLALMALFFERFAT
jgi:hypothetical protein